MRYLAAGLICLGSLSACSKSHTSHKSDPAPGPKKTPSGEKGGPGDEDPGSAPALDPAVQHIIDKHLTGTPVALGVEYLAAGLTVHADGTFTAQMARGFSPSIDLDQGTSVESTWKADGIHLIFDGLGTGSAGTYDGHPGISLTISNAGMGLGERTLLLNDAPHTTPAAGSSSTPPPASTTDPSTSNEIGQNPKTLENHTLVFTKDLVATAEQITSGTVLSDKEISVDLEAGAIIPRNSPVTATTLRCSITVYGLEAEASGPTTLLDAKKPYPVIGTMLQTGTTFVIMKGTATDNGTFIMDCTFGGPGLGPQRTVTTDDIKTVLGGYASFE